jgi:hypothetical protein
MLASKELLSHMQYYMLNFYVIIYRRNVSTKVFVYLVWNAPALNPCQEPEMCLVSPGAVATGNNNRVIFHTRLTISRYSFVNSVIS